MLLLGFFSPKYSPSELNSGSTENKISTFNYEDKMPPSLILRVAPFTVKSLY